MHRPRAGWSNRSAHHRPGSTRLELGCWDVPSTPIRDGRLLPPPANWRPTLASWTTRRIKLEKLERLAAGAVRVSTFGALRTVCVV